MKMPKLLHPKVVHTVMGLWSVSTKLSEIGEELKKIDITLTRQGVRYVIRRETGRLKTPIKRLNGTKNGSSPKVRTPDLIKKVKADLSGKKPLSIRQSAKKNQCSKSIIHRVAHEDLHGKVRNKYKSCLVR